MRARGYALSELLVAVAIAGLIIGVLTFLNVDYVQLGRRVSDISQPYRLGARAQRGDPCADPAGGVLTAADNEVISRSDHDNATVLTMSSQDGQTTVATPAGVAGSSRRPVRLVVEATPAPAASMVSVEVGGATVGTVAPRCDLRQVCDYDSANATCREDEIVAEPG
jgi:hypothetical protein